MMKGSISIAVVLLCFIQIFFVDANLLDDVCPRTPNPDLCFSSLQPYYKAHDPSSLREMAIVLGSTVLVNSVYTAIDKINEHIKETPIFQVGLEQCHFYFVRIRDGNIKRFREAMVKSNYDDAVLALYSIRPQTMMCSALSEGYSDVIDMCLEVNDLSKDAAYIVRDMNKFN